MNLRKDSSAVSPVLLILLVLAVGFAILFVFVLPSMQPSYPVQGSVYLCGPTYTDPPSGVPIFGVTVTFNGAYPVKSDVNGKWNVNLPAGTYKVHGALAGYSSFDGTLVVGGPVTYNKVCLTPLVGR